MSLFVHQENQTLLWQLIQQSPHWEPFNQSYGGHTQLWFKNIISLFYDKYWEMYSSSQMSVEELKKVNREVISYMINDIRKTVQPSASVSIAAPKPTHFTPEHPSTNNPFDNSVGEGGNHSVVIHNSQFHSNSSPNMLNHSASLLQTTKIEKEYETLDNSTYFSRLSQYDKPPEPQIQQTLSPYLQPSQTQSQSQSHSISKSENVDEIRLHQLQNSYNVQKEKEEKMEKAKKDFEDFQKRYNVGFERKPPPQIDFSMKLEEGKIRNIDDLVKRHMEEREKDLEGIPIAAIQ